MIWDQSGPGEAIGGGRRRRARKQGVKFGAYRRKREVSKQIRSWSYGQGGEGVLGEAQEGLVVCFGASFPWWGLVASRLKLAKVILVVDQVASPYLAAARSYFQSWQVNEAPKGPSVDPLLSSGF